MANPSQTTIEKLREMGTSLAPDVIRATQQLFFPKVLSNASKIRSTPKRAFQYGSLHRQQVDVYYPPGDSTKSPLLVFLYGGGLVTGDRVLPIAPQGIVYTNVGHYFSERGFVTMVADYRLVGKQGAKWPSGGEDVAALITWIQRHFAPPAGSDGSKLFVMGHSGGALHIGSWLLAPEFRASREESVKDGGVVVNSCILLCPPAHFRNAPPARKPAIEAYYGKDGGLETDCLCGLVKAAARGPPEARDAIRVLVMTAELDPEDEVLGPVREFVDMCQKDLAGCKVQAETMPGHNHFSPIYGLSSGEEAVEDWAEDVVGWIQTGEIGNHVQGDDKVVA